MGDVVGFFGTFGTPTAPGDNVFTDTGWFRFPAEGNRLYYISCTPLRCDNSNFTAQDLETRWVVTDTNGNGPTPLAATAVTVDNSMPINTGVIFALDTDPFASATVTFALQARELGGGTNLTWANVGGWNLYALDMGPLNAAMNNGGLGAPSGTVQRQTLYPALDSQSYDGNGNPLGGDAEAWRGDWNDSNGNTRSIVTFDGAQIRSDLTGASIQKAELTMFCLDAEEARGTLAFEGATNTTPPATLGAGTVDHSFDDDFPIGEATTVDVTSGFLDDIVNGDNAMHITASVLGFGAATKFAGYADVTRRPFLKVTYTK